MRIAGTMAEWYLAARDVGHLAACSDLRFRADCPHPSGGRLPAMLALIRQPDGNSCGIHRTYLRPDGSAKAAVEPNRASRGQVMGASIRLAEAAHALVVGEGIETAAAAGVLTKRPAWAAVAAGNLGAALMLPPIVTDVIVVVDRDPAGERAARLAAARWRAEGRRVRFLVPDCPGQDAADVLAASREALHA
jgi:putative DNA primase/helicase